MRIEWDDMIDLAADIYINPAITSYALRKKMTFNNYLESIKSSTIIDLNKDTIHSIRIG